MQRSKRRKFAWENERAERLRTASERAKAAREALAERQAARTRAYRKPAKPNRQRRTAYCRRKVVASDGGFVGRSRSTGGAVVIRPARHSKHTYEDTIVPLGVVVVPGPFKVYEVLEGHTYTLDSRGRWWLGNLQDGREVIHPRILKALRRRMPR